VAKDLSSIYQGIVLSQAVEESHWDTDYGYSSFDHRHRIVGGLVWEFPWFRDSESWALRNLIGGWQIGVTYHFTSGRRFNLVTPGSSAYDFNLDAQWGTDRPVWLGGSDYNEALDWQQGRPSIDADLFTDPEPPSASGDMSYYNQNIVPRNAFTWYPTYNVDISLQKNFIIPGGNRDYNLQLILDVFNLFKHQFWRVPGFDGSQANVYGLSTFGQVTQKLGDRIAQISIRFMF
jgi:hypothetical protein